MSFTHRSLYVDFPMWGVDNIVDNAYTGFWENTLARAYT
jgi:hypothetical protein